jgi:predicted phage-related endonuclease
MLPDLIVHEFPTREAWASARRDPLSIGASEAAAALGVSPFMGPWDLWTLKRHQMTQEHGAGAEQLLSRGHRWESAVLAEYEDASGHRVVAPASALSRRAAFVMLARRDLAWLRETPDAFAVDARTGELGHVEAKTALRRDGWSPAEGVVVERWADGAEALLPPYYAVQAYAQLAVTGMPWNDVCALVPDGGWLAVRWVRLLRDEDTQREIVDALTAWRAQHLVAGEPPEVDGSRACNRFLATTFKARDARTATPEEAQLLAELARLRAEQKSVERRVDALANNLTHRAAGARLCLSSEPGAPYGQPQVREGRASIDAVRLAAEFPDAYARCLKRSAPSVSFNTYRFDEVRHVG